jgi:hypothetical protein
MQYGCVWWMGRFLLYISRYTRIIKYGCKIVQSDNIIIQRLYGTMVDNANNAICKNLAASSILVLKMRTIPYVTFRDAFELRGSRQTITSRIRQTNYHQGMRIRPAESKYLQSRPVLFCLIDFNTIWKYTWYICDSLSMIILLSLIMK